MNSVAHKGLASLRAAGNSGSVIGPGARREKYDDSARFESRMGRVCVMPRKPKSKPAARQEFLVHKPTNSVGLVIAARTVHGEAQKTVELAGSERMTAATNEFRLATGPEIETHHRASGMARPCAVPEFPMSRPQSSRPAVRRVS